MAAAPVYASVPPYGGTFSGDDGRDKEPSPGAIWFPRFGYRSAACIVCSGSGNIGVEMVSQFGYARPPDGAYIAYRVDGDGPIDLVWQEDFYQSLDLSCREWRDL